MHLQELYLEMKIKDYHLEVKSKMDDSDESLPKYIVDENGQKRKLPRNVPEWLKTTAGFANYEGGSLNFST